MFALPSLGAMEIDPHCTLYIQGIKDSSSQKKQSDEYFVHVRAGGYDLGITDARSLGKFPSADDWYTFPKMFLIRGGDGNDGVEISLYKKKKWQQAGVLGSFRIEAIDEPTDSDITEHTLISDEKTSRLEVVLKCGREAVVPCVNTKDVQIESDNTDFTISARRQISISEKKDHQYLELVLRNEFGQRCITSMGFLYNDYMKPTVFLPDLRTLVENESLSAGLSIDKSLSEGIPWKKFALYRISIWSSEGKLRIHSHNYLDLPAKTISHCLEQTLRSIIDTLDCPKTDKCDHTKEERRYFRARSQHKMRLLDPRYIKPLNKMANYIQKSDGKKHLNCVTWSRNMYLGNLNDKCVPYKPKKYIAGKK